MTIMMMLAVTISWAKGQPIEYATFLSTFYLMTHPLNFKETCRHHPASLVTWTCSLANHHRATAELTSLMLHVPFEASST